MKRMLFLLVGLSLVTFGAESLPPNAEALKARRDAKIAEINRVYAAELEKLKKLALADGNLSGATVIQKEIEAVSPNPFKEESTMEPMAGKWKRRSDGAVFEFKDAKSGILMGNSGKEPFSITFNQESKAITMTAEKWTDTVVIGSNPNILSGIDKDGISYVLERSK